MSLIDQIEEFFAIFEDENVTLEYKNKLKESVSDAINHSSCFDELERAHKFLVEFKNKENNSNERIINSDLLRIGKTALFCGSLGAGLGFFASTLGSGTVIGSLLGIEIAGLKILSRQSSMKKIANEFEKEIRDRLTYKPRLSMSL